MEFFLGIILGGIAGVVIDRLYKRYVEGIPRVRVSSSCSFSVGRASFNLEVLNQGNMQLPPYEVVLHHPTSGYFRCFPKIEESDRFPGQKEVFAFVHAPTLPNAAESDRATLSFLTLSPESHKPLSQEEFKKWKLELHLTHSHDVVLFEDAQAGAAIAEILKGIVQSKEVNPTGQQMWRARANNSWIITSKRIVSAGFVRVKSWWKWLSGGPKPLSRNGGSNDR